MPRRSRSSAPPGLSRRELLRGGLGSMGVVALGPGCSEDAPPLVPRACARPEDSEVVYGRLSPASELLVEAFIDTSIDEVFSVCTEALRVNSPQTVLGALLVAGVRAITPRSGGALHAPMSIHAAHQLQLWHEGPEALVPLYYAARALKNRQGGAVLGRAPEARPRTAEQAVTRFDAAMSAYDPEAADVALLELFASLPPEQAVERLLLWSTREDGDIGHLMIWFGLAVRNLDALGWNHAPSVLRSVISDATTRTPSGFQPLYLENLERLRHGTPRPGECTADEGLTRELVVELRRKDPIALSAWVLDLVEGSAPTRAIWDAFAVSGTEDLVRNGGGIAVHRFDGMNALHHLWRRSADPLTRQLVMVQTAAYLCTLSAPEDIDVFVVQPLPVDTLDEVFDGVAAGPLGAAERTLGWLEGGGTMHDLQTRAIELTIRKAHRVDEHCFKFPVAVLEEVALASEPWQPLVLAAIGGEYGRSPSTVGGDWEHLDEVMAEIATL